MWIPIISKARKAAEAQARAALEDAKKGRIADKKRREERRRRQARLTALMECRSILRKQVRPPDK